MSEERRRILNMLAEGKITADEAERLLDALGRAEEARPSEVAENGPAKRAKYLRVQVAPKHEGRDQVNIRVPLALVRAGVKLGGVMPNGIKGRVNEALASKGINMDVNQMDARQLEQMIDALGEMSIDVDDEKETVRIFCE